jgi:membrane-associated phospholipid phosphatase
MKKIFEENKIFLIPYFILLSSTLIVISIFSKAEIHIWFNGFHTRLFDKIMPIYTNLGDGTVSFVLLIVLLFIKYRWAVASAVSNVLVIISTYVLKQIIFNNAPRPRNFFENIYTGHYHLYLVTGTNPEWMDSFPSGHSTTAFAVFFLIAAVSKNKFIKAAMLFLAITVGYSRIYMSNHFLQDVVGGSVLGLSSTICGLLIADKIKTDRIEKSILKK